MAISRHKKSCALHFDGLRPRFVQAIFEAFVVLPKPVICWMCNTDMIASILIFETVGDHFLHNKVGQCGYLRRKIEIGCPLSPYSRNGKKILTDLIVAPQSP